MFLRCTKRNKDGKEHRYWNVVENRRVTGGRVVQRQVLYLGEINDSQRQAWRKTIEVFEDGAVLPRTIALFPEDRPVEIDDDDVVQIRLKDLEPVRLNFKALRRAKIKPDGFRAFIYYPHAYCYQLPRCIPRLV